MFIVFATAMLLTKESGCVLVIALSFSELMNYLFSKEKSLAYLLRKQAVIAIPVGFAFVYFFIQKMQYGFFLYPLHANYILSGWTKITSALPNLMAYLFIYDGRNG